MFANSIASPPAKPLKPRLDWTGAGAEELDVCLRISLGSVTKMANIPACTALGNLLNQEKKPSLLTDFTITILKSLQEWCLPNMKAEKSHAASKGHRLDYEGECGHHR